MTDTGAALNSEYIIDGLRMESTPFQMLCECTVSDCGDTADGVSGATVVDEISGIPHVSFCPDRKDIHRYLEQIRDSCGGGRAVPSAYSGSFTRMRIAAAVIGSIWKDGHFSLDEMTMEMDWEWDFTPVGSMAAFYFSAEAASQYLFDLGVRLSDYSLKESFSGNRLLLKNISVNAGAGISGLCGGNDASLPESPDEDFLQDQESAGQAVISAYRKCGEDAVDDNKSWIIYIPFDTCQYRLGGSVLCGRLGSNGDPAPEIKDPDYFIDCFEVVRELVEDGIVLSGVTVADGGLIAAADRMFRQSGCCIDITGIGAAYAEQDPVRILFSEIPGVLIQISDSDYDYVDSQLLLQDIAYYPIGHPESGYKGVRVSENGRPDVVSILSALLQGQSSEGED